MRRQKRLCSLLEERCFDVVSFPAARTSSLRLRTAPEATRKREAFPLDFAGLITPALRKTKVYITGGFRTVGAMVKTLNSIDGISLARAVCQEPRLCRAMLNRKLKGAIELELDQNSFAIMNVTVGSQMEQIGQDREPIDLSNQRNVDAFLKNMGVWSERLAKDSQQQEYGYVDLFNAEPVRYGTAVAYFGQIRLS